MSFRRYPKYKDSGVHWLGEVPEHWEVRPIKALAMLKGGAGFPDAEQGIENEELYFYKVAALGQADVKGILQPPPDSISRDTARRLGAFVFPEGTLTFAKVGAALLLARIRQIPAPSCLDNNMMGMLVNEENDTRFVLFAMSLVRFDLIANPGAVPSLNASQIGNFQLALPPPEEQTAIAAFLDRETAKIDALVTEQEKLIALLQEKRQAVISHAVTKGLDPNVPMKDSGVEWLGEVPGHWEVCALRRVIAAIEQGWSPECYAREAEDQEWGVLKAGCLNGGIFRPSENKALPPELPPEVAYEVRVGDVLMSRASGSPELVGSTALVKATREQLMLSDKIFRLKLKGFINAAFFVAALNSRPLRIQIENALSGGNGMANNLPQSSLLTFAMAVPPMAEQATITVFLEQETAKLDTLMTEARTAITLLQERRTALISAAVTGQIDVRGLGST